MEKCRSTRCTGRFETRRWYTCDSHPRRHIRRQVILPYKRRSREIAEVECLYLRSIRARVLQRLLTGFHRERPEIAIRERTKRRLPYADHRNLSHIFSG